MFRQKQFCYSLMDSVNACVFASPPMLSFVQLRLCVPFLFYPQDFTGVPAVVDLAAMRDAMKELGGDPNAINPQVKAMHCEASCSEEHVLYRLYLPPGLRPLFEIRTVFWLKGWG